jgi:lipopolysaccharide export system ATP-binding protein
MSSVLLSAHKLSKSYRHRLVLNKLSLEVAQGEVVGLLGPNGAGKSTAFNIVAGLVRPDEGTIVLDGQAMERLPLFKRAQKGLGYLPQESTIFRKLSVLHNLAAVFELQGVSSADSIKKAQDVAERYELTHIANNLGCELSGGERRRVEMARALIPDPKVILLDEPFAGVDPIAVQDIQRFIQGMCERGIGVLLTDHNVRETLQICHRAYLIAKGQILVQGAAEDIVADPKAQEIYLGENFSLLNP